MLSLVDVISNEYISCRYLNLLYSAQL